MSIIEEVTQIIDLLYQHGWDERNGGNLSYIITEEEAKTFCNPQIVKRSFTYDFDMTELIGRYILITGTGKYFKNCKQDPKDNLGLIYICNAHQANLLWGFEDGGRPTSEAPTHLKCHMKRLNKDPMHRLVIHCHPTNIICMTHIVPLDSNKFTEILWKMQTESLVVFPEGVAVLPWILCGGEEIGIATSELMEEYRSVIWAQHGLFSTGQTLDEVFGLIETIEKAAEIYMKICSHSIVNTITNDNLKELAKAFHITYRKGIID